MTARRGAALAGALLAAMPVLDILLGGGVPAVVRAIVGLCGLALLVFSSGVSRRKEWI